jgi:Flp pilus assembly protein TadD
MHHLHSIGLLCLLAVCAGCAASDPPKQTPRTLASNQRTDMLIRLGDDMRRNGDATGAIGLYRVASRAAPHDPLLLQHMGGAFLDTNDPARAEQAFRGALDIDPGDLASDHGLALALLAQGRAAEALPILQRLARGSSDPALLRAEGTALDMVGNPGAAQAVYRRGLRLAPIDADLHGNLALSLALSGDAAGALAQMQAAIASPNPDPRQNANAVLVLALAGNTAAARTRGNATIGSVATDALLARAEQAGAATDARSRAAAVGVLANNASGALPVAATLLPPAAATPVSVIAPLGPGPAKDQATGSEPPPATQSNSPSATLSNSPPATQSNWIAPAPGSFPTPR